MSDVPSRSLQQLRDDWRERLRAACDRATEQVAGMGLADLRALRVTIEEEIDRLEAALPAPGPVQAQGPMTAEEQAQHVQTALQYNALQVRKQVVQHALRRRALGPVAVERTLDVPTRTKHFASLAWEVMGEPDVETTDDVYREVARRADEDVHLTTVEMWLQEKNPHYPDQGRGAEGRWTVLRRAVLLASA